MQFARLIDRVKIEPYHFAGVYVLSSPPFHTFPLRGNFEFVRDDDALVVQGGVQDHAHSTPKTFVLRIPFKTMSLHSAWATLESYDLGLLEGRIVSTGEEFEFLASSPQKTLCAMHMAFSDQYQFVVSGMLTIDQHSIAFTLKDQAEWEHSAASKVLKMVRR